MKSVIVLLCFCLLSPVMTHAQQTPPFIPPVREPITVDNADEITRFGTLGRGWQMRDAAWSPSGELIAVATLNAIAVYNADDLLQSPHMVLGHTASVTNVAFSPDGEYLASVGQDSTLRIWDTTTWQIINAWPHKGALTYGVEFSPNGTYLAIHTYFDRERASLIFSFPQGDLVVETAGDAAFDASEGYVYASTDATLIRQSLATGETETLFTFLSPWSPIALNLEKNWVVMQHGESNDDDLALSLWDLETGEPLTEAPSEGNMAFFSPDGSVLLVGCWICGELSLWNIESWIETGDPARVEMNALSTPLRSAAFHPDGTRLALVGWEDNHGRVHGELVVWEMSSNLPVSRTRITAPVTNAAIDDRASRVYYQGHIWDLSTGREIHFTERTLWEVDAELSRAVTYDSAQWSIHYSRGGAYECPYQPCERLTAQQWEIATGALLNANYTRGPITATIDGYELNLIDTTTNAVLDTLHHWLPVSDFTFSPDYSTILTESHNLPYSLVTLGLWDTATGERLNRIRLAWGEAEFSYSPDGRFLSIWAAPIPERILKNDVVVWNTQTGQAHRFIGPDRGYVQQIVYSPDGQSVAIVWGDWDNIIEIYDLQSGMRIDRIGPFSYIVSSMVYSSDGQWLAISVMDAIWIYDVQRQEFTQKFRYGTRIDAWPTVLNFSPDHQLLSILVPHDYYGGRVPEYKTDLWHVRNGVKVTELPGTLILSSSNWDLLITENLGFVSLWGIASQANTE